MDFNIGVPPESDGQNGVAPPRVFPLKAPLDEAPRSLPARRHEAGTPNAMIERVSALG